MKKTVLRFVLGLKIRQLRLRSGLSLKELAERSDLSISYLNEIEKGKKYPKVEKLASLAKALEVDLGDLVSFKTGRHLHPLLKFLEGDLISNLPLDLFGLGESDVVDLMANAPEKFASSVLTVLQLSRAFDVKLEDLYHAALRSYIELNDNSFGDIEKLAKKVRSEWGLNSERVVTKDLIAILKEKFNYQLDEKSLVDEPLFKEIECKVKRGPTSTIFLNRGLEEGQKKYYLAKEIGHSLLGMTENAQGLLALIEDFKAGYFASTLLIDEKMICKDLKQFFSNETFDQDFFLGLIDKYQVSPDSLIHRITQLLPSHFKINEFFFLGMFSKTFGPEKYDMNKELHLSQLHSPHGQRMNETYCRRWVAIRSLKQFKKLNDEKAIKHHILGQISLVENGQHYFSISLAKRSNFKEKTNQSLTIGFLMNDELKNVIKFLNDPALIEVPIGQTCERCSRLECVERMAPASIYLAEIEKEKREKAFTRLLNS